VSRQNHFVGPITWTFGMPFKKHRRDGQRSAAKLAGENKYFTGRPCAKGHVSQRLTSTGTCCQCSDERYIAKYEEIKAQATQWRKDHPELRRLVQKRSNIKHAATIKAKRTEVNKTEKAKIKRRLYVKEWKKKFPEKNLAKQRKRRDKHRDKYRVYWASVSAKRRGAIGKFTKANIDSIRIQQKGKCAYCKIALSKVREHRDHIVPISRGGTNFPSNLQLLCARCNLQKSASDPIDHAQSLGMLL
jgi:5-methylcytosine-specific restriction endonuclease McrA